MQPQRCDDGRASLQFSSAGIFFGEKQCEVNEEDGYMKRLSAFGIE